MPRSLGRCADGQQLHLVGVYGIKHAGCSGNGTSRSIHLTRRYPALYTSNAPGRPETRRPGSWAGCPTRRSPSPRGSGQHNGTRGASAPRTRVHSLIPGAPAPQDEQRDKRHWFVREAQLTLSLRTSPGHMPATPRSQPLMTLPAPRVKSNGWFRSSAQSRKERKESRDDRMSRLPSWRQPTRRVPLAASARSPPSLPHKRHAHEASNFSPVASRVPL